MLPAYPKHRMLRCYHKNDANYCYYVAHPDRITQQVHCVLLYPSLQHHSAEDGEYKP